VCVCVCVSALILDVVMSEHRVSPA
jgi:hypothetical protein